ncbi:MAG: hypothetical protein ACXVLQ_15440 [Bacteriovorax sp.]
MQKPSVEELAMGEREFLHDIANHIVVAHGMSNLVHKTLKENKSIDDRDIERLERAINAINKMTDLLKQRRSMLHSLAVE